MLFPKIGMYFYNLHKKGKQKMATFLCNIKINNKVASFFLHIVILLNRLLRLFGGSSERLLFDTAVIVFAAHPLNSCAKSHYRGMIFPLFSSLSKLLHLELFCRTTKIKLPFIKIRIVSMWNSIHIDVKNMKITTCRDVQSSEGYFAIFKFGNFRR